MRKKVRKKSKNKFFLFRKIDIRYGTIIGIIAGILGVILASFLIHSFIIGTINLGQGDLYNPFIDKQITKGYERVSDSWQDSKFVKSLSYICSLQKTELDKVKCVHYYINNTFNYTKHGWGNQLRESPEEIILNGGICRDWSVMLCSIYEKLGLECNFIHEPSHVYINVTCEDCDFYCDVDMRCLRCFENKKDL